MKVNQIHESALLLQTLNVNECKFNNGAFCLYAAHANKRNEMRSLEIAYSNTITSNYFIGLIHKISIIYSTGTAAIVT